MKRSACGFTLIEWVIYFFLIMVVVLGVFQFAVGVRKHVVNMTTQAGSLAHASAALDALVRDLALAPQSLGAWREQGPSKLAWRKGNVMIAWGVEHGSVLVRKERQFDQETHQWKAERASIVAREVVALNAQALYLTIADSHERIMTGMTLDVEFRGHEQPVHVHTTVALRQGRVL